MRLGWDLIVDNNTDTCMLNNPQKFLCKNLNNIKKYLSRAWVGGLYRVWMMEWWTETELERMQMKRSLPDWGSLSGQLKSRLRVQPNNPPPQRNTIYSFTYIRIGLIEHRTEAFRNTKYRWRWHCKIVLQLSDNDKLHKMLTGVTQTRNWRERSLLPSRLACGSAVMKRYVSYKCFTVTRITVPADVNARKHLQPHSHTYRAKYWPNQLAV
jgi:hypothetical protein